MMNWIVRYQQMYGRNQPAVPKNERTRQNAVKIKIPVVVVVEHAVKSSK